VECTFENPVNRGDGEVSSIRLPTDRTGEVVSLSRSSRLPGVDFWSVADSERHWSMLHDTFTACFVKGPHGAVRGRWRSRGAERTVAAGCVQLMEAGEAHRTTAVTEPTSFFVVWWTSAALSQAAAEVGVTGEIHWKEPQLDRPDLATTFGKLAESVDQGDGAAVEHWFAEATGALLDGASEKGVERPRYTRRHPSVRRAIEYLHDNFAERVSLDDLARESRISKFHLARCFRETTGLAPHQYQKLLRIQAARRHLEGGTSVQEAAERSGFADGPHLTRTFREWLGIAPSAWAKAARATKYRIADAR
jgi:AraC-like DNA-binding protein